MLARIANATRPTIHLCEVVSEQQLERLLLLLVGTDFNRGDISWGGAWAQYSLTCMLQDILAGNACRHISESVAVASREVRSEHYLGMGKLAGNRGMSRKCIGMKRCVLDQLSHIDETGLYFLPFQVCLLSHRLTC